MKISLEHLPEERQAELRSITAQVLEIIQPQMLVLFGSYARGNWVYELGRPDEFTGARTSYISDYDVLVVMENRRKKLSKIEEELARKINRYERYEVPFKPIVHDIASLNRDLQAGHYFFCEIVREGILLYNTGQYELAEPLQLKPKERANKAQDYLDKWSRNAGEFLIDFQNAFNRGSYAQAAFMLHQAAERFFAAIYLVFVDDKLRIHNLYKLYKDVSTWDKRFAVIFPLHTPEEKTRFDLFNRAYIEARYNPQYHISREDLEYLSGRVALLQELTDSICREQIERYRQGGSPA